MKWRSIKFDWNRARAFLVTAEEGSYSAAAKAMDMSQPTLGRQVAALESELCVTLFERVGRGLELTQSGLEILEVVRDMGTAANELSLRASGQSECIEGSVCITATEAMAVYILPPIIAKLRSQAPGIQVEIIASNNASDLRKREADIAIRNFQPRHSDLIARKLKNGDAHLYATPDYLRRIGNPSNLETLAHADFVGFTSNTPLIKAMHEVGLALSPENFPLTSASHIVHWELVKSGAAIGIMPEVIGAAEPSVVRVLEAMEPFVFETWLVVHRELRTNRRVRKVYEFLAYEFEDLF